MITLTGVKKHFPIRGGVFKREIDRINVLNGIDLTLRHGKVTGLVGESGCGKSTLAKLIIKLMEPDSGTISFEGKTLAALKGKAKRDYFQQVQIIFQDPYSSLNPRLKVKHIIGEMLRIRGLDKATVIPRVLQMLADVGLSAESLEKYPHEFSGGQRQRIAIARALIVRPKLLIADEPVSALDLALQVKTLALLKELKEKYDLTILLISHDLKTVAEFCDTVVVMYLGKIVEMISGQTLFQNGLHPYLKILINSIPVRDPLLRDRDKQIVMGEIPDPAHIPPGCPFHPRCPARIEPCDRIEPKLGPATRDGHLVACHLF
ncbi:MAG: ATP-binding cassette domain-containing protein [Desulfobacteraceae bacterium]|nr:MAG: ATP-binding cassette domain-containing protein [Desulfobacteraceae bacterium]